MSQRLKTISEFSYVNLWIANRVEAINRDLVWFHTEAKVLSAPRDGVLYGLHHWDSIIDAFTVSGMTPAWMDHWQLDSIDDLHYGEAHPDLQSAHPAFPRISVLRDYPLYIWPGFFTLVYAGEAFTANVAFLKPDEDNEPLTKPTQYNPAVIGVAYAVTTAGGECGEADGLVLLIVPGPALHDIMGGLLVVYVKCVNGVCQGM
jgi:hypothetical protein